MQAVIKEDTKILFPNIKHKSFSDGSEVIPKGTIVTGEVKYIEGLREGKPFTYRLFLLNGERKKLIYLNKIEPHKMEKTEVNLNATGQSSSPTVVNMRPAEYFSKMKLIGLFAGAAAGYFYHKKKGGSMAKAVGIGAVLGYGAAFVIESSHKVEVKQ